MFVTQENVNEIKISKMKLQPTTKIELTRNGSTSSKAVPPTPTLDLSCAETIHDVAAHLPQAMLAPKLLLTVRDCAALASLSEKTILRLLQRKKLRCLSSIRHKRIPASELARFIRENLS